MKLDANSEIVMLAGAVVGFGALAFILRKLFGPSPRPGASNPTSPAAAAIYRLPQYRPLAPETIELFTSAAKYTGLPIEWASSIALHNVLAKESGGWVGRPNYQFGSIATDDASRANWVFIWDAIRRGTWRSMLVEPHRSKPNSEQSSATGLGQLTATNIASGNSSTPGSF